MFDSLYFVECFYEFGIFLDFTLAYCVVYIAPYDIATPATTARIFFERAHGLPIPPMAIPPMSYVLIAHHVLQPQRARLIYAKAKEAKRDDGCVEEQGLGRVGEGFLLYVGELVG